MIIYQKKLINPKKNHQKKLLQIKSEGLHWKPIKKRNTDLSAICKMQSEAFKERFDIDLESTNETFQRIWMPEQIDDFSAHMFSLQGIEEKNRNILLCSPERKSHIQTCGLCKVENVYWVDMPFNIGFLCIHLSNTTEVNPSIFINYIAKRTYIKTTNNSIFSSKSPKDDLKSWAAHM